MYFSISIANLWKVVLYMLGGGDEFSCSIYVDSQPFSKIEQFLPLSSNLPGSLYQNKVLCVGGSIVKFRVLPHGQISDVDEWSKLT